LRKFGLVLIILGIAIMSYPWVNQQIDRYLQERMLREMDFTEQEAEKVVSSLSTVFERLIGEQVGSDLDIDDDIEIVGYEEFTEPDSEPTTEVVTETPSEPATPAVKLTALGSIEIPTIGIKMPVVAGTGDTELKRSAGHMTGTAMPGEIGNSVLAGHRGYAYGRLFNRLNEIVIGDLITVKTKSGTFTYEVYATKIVEPNDLSVLNTTRKHRVLTLITCEPMFKSTHRIIIHAVIRD
jgi:sortase A